MEDGGVQLLSEIGDGRLVKMEVDYTDQVEKAIPEAEKLAKAGQLQSGLDQLYALEKQTRLGADMHSNAKIQVAIVRLCYEANNWTALNENVMILSKKRSLIKQATAKMVQQCCEYVGKITDKPTMLKLIDTLRIVTEGKIYVEVERARLTSRLSKILEEDGDLKEAAKVLLELQVETFGSMDKHEKVSLLLEQMRLSLARKDYTRAQIISKKISVKFFEDTGSETQQLKLKYYGYMIELDQNDSNYLAICRHYMAVYKTPVVQQDDLKLKEALKCAVIFILLTGYGNERSDLFHRIRADKNLEKIPQFLQLMTAFNSKELISWQQDIVATFQQLLTVGLPDCSATGTFDLNSEPGKKRWGDLKIRTMEHNIRMIAQYYSTIRLDRLAELLDSPSNTTEEFLCQMVTSGIIPAVKIDRPSGVATFVATQTPIEVLDEWSTNLSHVMEMLNRSSHLILKEEMVNRHLRDQKV